ncbi:hypothetical protein FXF69_36865 [Actinomadura chibensis]|uniref:Uncharacterized protein n=1 Tax=Actinomadura chibensis TaxID=392828 RepID=A0A5D0N9V6_9ACTN|nr:hypothetical protein FXF69_36865 [Actinomadura chibensis]
MLTSWKGLAFAPLPGVCSPRTWGWSRSRLLGQPVDGVLPAHAGMVPSSLPAHAMEVSVRGAEVGVRDQAQEACCGGDLPRSGRRSPGRWARRVAVSE